MRKKILFIFIIVFIVGIILIALYISQTKKNSEGLMSFSCPDCNVILISIDTLGAKHLGLYGGIRNTSPFLDTIAAERGIVFENAIAQASWTLPSHTAMLTGQYPADLGMWTPNDALPTEAKTIAEALQENGYQTQAFSNGSFIQPEWGFDQGFDSFSGHLTPEYWDDVPNIFEQSRDWLSTTGGTPFFLFIHSFHVHDPYTPSQEAMEALGEKGIKDVHISEIVEANTKKGGPTKEDADTFRAAYHGEIRELDDALRAFFQELENSDLLENTIVILTADHGEEFGEHGTVGFHVSLYDETIRVPLIYFLPNTKAKRIAEVVEIRSIPGTIVDLLELPSRKPLFQDTSLLPLMHGESKGGRIALSTTGQKRDAVMNIIEDAYQNLGEFGKTVFPEPREEEWENPFASSARSAKWHLIRNMDDSTELYDVSADPEEQIDLSSSWQDLDAEDRKEIFKLFQILDINPKIPCRPYCPPDDLLLL